VTVFRYNNVVNVSNNKVSNDCVCEYVHNYEPLAKKTGNAVI
jgi:hypothetical protein